MSALMSESTARTERRDVWWWLLRLVVVASGVELLISLFDDARGKWDGWEQGDWLINSLNAPIRRGPVGSMIIHLADGLGITPVTAVVLVQVVLTVLLYAAWYRVLTWIPDARLALLLTVSSGLFVLMWPANLYEGALRKELLGMTAAALLLVWLRRPEGRWQVGLLLLATAILTVGVWGHEVVILFVPLAGYLLWLGTRGADRARTVVVGACAVVIAVSAVLAGLYALHHTRVHGWHVVCDPVTSRGVADRICDGAINWTKAVPHRASVSLHHRDLNARGLRNFAIMLVISLAAPAYLALILRRRRTALLGALAAVPFLPLFAIVSDWGRWLSCCVFAFVAVLLAHGVREPDRDTDRAQGGLALRRTPAAAVVLVLLALGLLAVPDHINGIHWGGVVTRTPRLLRELLHSLT